MSAAGTAQAPARLLVVDDTPHNVKLLADILGVKGYRVVTAASGEEALAKVASEAPDLMLLDVMMPGELDGYQVCSKVKQHPVLGAHTKVILLTARAQQEDMEQGRRAGSDAYLTKAFSPLKLLDLVDGMLGRTV